MEVVFVSCQSIPLVLRASLSRWPSRPSFFQRPMSPVLAPVHSWIRPPLHPSSLRLTGGGGWRAGSLAGASFACLSVTSGHATQHPPQLPPSLSFHPTHHSLSSSLGLRSLGPRLNGIFSHFFVSFPLEVDHVWTKTLLLLGAIHTTLFTQTLLAEISRVFLEVATFSLMCCSCVSNKVTYGFSFLTWPPHSGGQSSVDMSHLSPSKCTKTCR